jgi:ubiquinone/menaquinone biosynthesis C-methylase UbiE
MDYDKSEIATTYDEARALAPQTARLWMDLLAEHVGRSEASLIIDLGCGTGRFSELLAAHFEAEVIGVDPSEKMVAQARIKPAIGKVSYRQGSAEAVPLPDGCADLVFMSMIYHHLADPPAAAREIRRVLREPGYVGVRNATRECDFPHRHFFPGLGKLTEAHLPSRQEISGVLTAAGLKPIVDQVITQVTALDWPSFVAKSALRADSFLARLSDDDFEQGMVALRSPGDKINQNDPVTEEIAWLVFARLG